MAERLIRHLRKHVLRMIDPARRRWLSGTACLRRQPAGVGRGGPVSSAELVNFGETYVDLGDDDVMGRAWR